MKKIAIITLNNPGLSAAEETVEDLLKVNKEYEIIVYHKNSNIIKKTKHANYEIFQNIDNIKKQIWQNSDAIIWFAATGIVIRKISGLLESKVTDPANIVINLDRTQIIPLLSGHIGGANELTRKLVKVNPDLTPFVTTASDTLNVFAFDEFAKKYSYDLLNINVMPEVTNSLINEKPINIITYRNILKLLEINGLDLELVKFYDYQEMFEPEDKTIPTVILSPFEVESITSALVVKIKPVALGIGLNSGTSSDEIYEDVLNFLKMHKMNTSNIRTVASYEGKSDEKGLYEIAKNLGCDLVFFNKEQINNLETELSPSKAQQHLNIKGVAEPAAILAAPNNMLVVKKNKFKNTTIAAAI